MPPEMITTVAPTAMIAKKLASVAVWISVWPFRKWLSVWPVALSTWVPAKIVSTVESSRMTRTSPVCCERSSLSSTGLTDRLPQALGRLLGQEVALRLGRQLEADQELPDRGRAQQRR